MVGHGHVGRGSISLGGGGGTAVIVVVAVVEGVHVGLEDLVEDVEEVVGRGVPLGIFGGDESLLRLLGLLKAEAPAARPSQQAGQLGRRGQAEDPDGIPIPEPARRDAEAWRASAAAPAVVALQLQLLLHLLHLLLFGPGNIITANNEAGHAVKVGLGVRIRRGPRPVALDLGPVDVLREERTAAEEQLVVVRAGIRTAGEALEAVKVELPLEAGELALVEVLGHDLVGELRGPVNEEGAAVRLPANDVGPSLGLDARQHVVKADGEGRFYPPAGDVRHDARHVVRVIVVLMRDLTALAFAFAAVIVAGGFSISSSSSSSSARGQCQCRRLDGSWLEVIAADDGRCRRCTHR